MLDLPYPGSPGRTKMGCGVSLLVSAVLFVVLLGVPLSLVDDPKEGTHPWEPILACSILASPAIGIAILLMFLDRRDGRIWNKRMDLWERGVRVWMALRYCHRDHVVYRWPDLYFPPAATKQFVYDQVMTDLHRLAIREQE